MCYVQFRECSKSPHTGRYRRAANRTYRRIEPNEVPGVRFMERLEVHGKLGDGRGESAASLLIFIDNWNHQRGTRQRGQNRKLLCLDVTFYEQNAEEIRG